MQQSSETFTAEIKALEAKLEAKKREMAASGVEHPEQHVFRAVVREHAGQENAKIDLTGAGIPPVAGSAAATQAISSSDEKKLDQLVLYAFSKGIASAVSEAKRMNIPYLVDLLHDRLADEYYQKLLDSRKLNAD